MNQYKDYGYNNRTEYLQSLVERTGQDIAVIQCLAELLGQDEDFDALIVALEGCQPIDRLFATNFKK